GQIPPFSYRGFRWAIGIVFTRQNRLPRAGALAPGAPPPLSSAGLHTIALIPGWDFCNYRDGRIASFYNPPADALDSFAMADVKKGQQIFIYYGNRPNSKRTGRADTVVPSASDADPAPACLSSPFCVRSVVSQCSCGPGSCTRATARTTSRCHGT